MATTILVHDDGEYSNARGSSVLYCSFDAEWVVDAIPFPILFDSASHVLPILCWTVMYYEYLLIGCACYCTLWTFMPMLYDM